MTTAENIPENRLDSIERMLAATAASLQTVAANQVLFEARMTRFEQNMERFEQNLERFEQNMETSISDLATHIIQLVEEGERDRATFQAEIRRIWDYLTGQQRNGHGQG
jgi:DNA anti-recombination protein RmuC